MASSSAPHSHHTISPGQQGVFYNTTMGLTLAPHSNHPRHPPQPNNGTAAPLVTHIPIMELRQVEQVQQHQQEQIQGQVPQQRQENQLHQQHQRPSTELFMLCEILQSPPYICSELCPSLCLI